MKTKPLTLMPFALLLVFALAAAVRFAGLGSRPMHADEAVQASIFSDLLEHGDYRYDPAHYHGPLPHFINLPLMRALGVRSLDDLQAWQFRLQPALAGVLLVILAGACAHPFNGSVSRVGRFLRNRRESRETNTAVSEKPPYPLDGCPCADAAARWRAMLLAAISPTLVYFSRMAIHETLLALCALAVPFAIARWLEHFKLKRGPHAACVTGSGGLQTAGRGATRLAIEKHLDAQNQTGRDCVASGGLETAPPSYRTRSFYGYLFAAAAAVAFGCMHATKETWSIIAFSWAVAALVLWPRKIWGAVKLAVKSAMKLAVKLAAKSAVKLAVKSAVKPAVSSARSRRNAPIVALVVVAVMEVAMGVSFLLYSNFGRHAEGFADAWRTLFAYRTGGGHEKSWWYFLADCLGFYRAGGWFAGEGVICLLALAGGVAALAQGAAVSRPPDEAQRASPPKSIWALKNTWARLRRVGRSGDRPSQLRKRGASAIVIPPLPLFLAVSGAAQVVVYSIIRYKTPWLMLVPLVSFVPLAAHGWAWLQGQGRPGRFSWRGAACALAVAAGLAAPMVSSSFIAPTNTDFRFVYAPTLPEADAELARIAAVLPADALVAVIGDDYWPLPWYFRAMRERVGYFSEADAPPPAQLRAFALVIHAGAQLAPSVTGQGWRVLELRPGYYVSVSR